MKCSHAILQYILVVHICLPTLYSFVTNPLRTLRQFPSVQLRNRISPVMAFDTIVQVDSNFEAKCSLLADPGYSLTDYMQLPVDQYVCIKMPLNATLVRMENNQFNLTVPPVRFFNFDVSPMIICEVKQAKDSVIIESNVCVLRGSPFVETLNGCFHIEVRTVFKWIDTTNRKSIRSRSEIYVEVDPPSPFKFFGKTILESTGTIAMKIALNQIENAFVQSLAKDYERWATDGEYRQSRASSASILTSQLTQSSNESVVDASVVDQQVNLTEVEISFLSEVSPSIESNETNETNESNESDKSNEIIEIDKRSPKPNIIVVPTEMPVFNIYLDSEPAAVEEQITTIPSEPEPVSTIESPPTGLPSSTIADLIFKNTGYEMGSAGDKDAPEYLTDSICLLPGEPVVRIEEAPSNSRRIFTGVDIMSDLDKVWNVLTDYENLDKVVPSLVTNEVLYKTPNGGARIYQVGGAKVLPGITFKAKTVLDINIYLESSPIPPSLLAEEYHDEVDEKDEDRVKFYRNQPLQRNKFPRPYAITSLPHRDITMQNVEGEGDFDHYQGLWRMQSLPGCAPEGGSATRLTYAVEIKPKGFLPVGLIEGRIAADLRTNLRSIRDYVEGLQNTFVGSDVVEAIDPFVESIDVDSNSNEASVEIATESVPEESSVLNTANDTTFDIIHETSTVTSPDLMNDSEKPLKVETAEDISTNATMSVQDSNGFSWLFDGVRSLFQYEKDTNVQSESGLRNDYNLKSDIQMDSKEMVIAKQQTKLDKLELEMVQLKDRLSRLESIALYSLGEK